MTRSLPTREELRAYALRRWDLVEDAKRGFVSARFSAEGPLGSRAAALRLAARWRALHPDAPLAAMREADLEAHVALKRKLDEGAARFTEDVDVTVDLGARPHAELVAALAKEGLELRVGDERFVERTRVLPMIHRASRTPVDVVLAGPGIEQLFLDGATRIEIEGVEVPVARAEHVIVMKVLAGRAKDMEDVVAILAAQGAALDDACIRELLTALENALDQSDLVPAFERCRAKV